MNTRGQKRRLDDAQRVASEMACRAHNQNDTREVKNALAAPVAPETARWPHIFIQLGLVGVLLLIGWLAHHGGYLLRDVSG
jgi:hypothetical protein